MRAIFSIHLHRALRRFRIEIELACVHLLELFLQEVLAEHGLVELIHKHQLAVVLGQLAGFDLAGIRYNWSAAVQ